MTPIFPAAAICRQKHHPTADNSENCEPFQTKTKPQAAARLPFHAQCSGAEPPRFVVVGRLGLLRVLISQRRPLTTIAPLSHSWRNRCIGRLEAKPDNNSHPAPATTCLTPLGYSAQLTDWIRSHAINRAHLHLPVHFNNTA